MGPQRENMQKFELNKLPLHAFTQMSVVHNAAMIC